MADDDRQVFGTTMKKIKEVNRRWIDVSNYEFQDLLMAIDDKKTQNLSEQQWSDFLKSQNKVITRALPFEYARRDDSAQTFINSLTNSFERGAASNMYVKDSEYAKRVYDALGKAYTAIWGYAPLFAKQDYHALGRTRNDVQMAVKDALASIGTIS